MLVQSLPRMVLLLVAIGVSYETFSPLLHLVQQGKVALGTAHPVEWAILHDGPHLHLVQLHEVICVKWLLEQFGVYFHS